MVCSRVCSRRTNTQTRLSLLLADVRDASCIIYVLCALSAVHKSQMLLLSTGPGAVNMLEQGDAKPNNNKQVFSVTNSSHFGTNNKSGADREEWGGSSGLSTTGGLKLQGLFFVFFFFGGGGSVRTFFKEGAPLLLSCFSCHYQVDEGVSRRLSRLPFWSAVLAG